MISGQRELRSTAKPATDTSAAALAWLGLFAGSLGAAAVLTPLLYLLLGAWPATSGWPFSRVFNRTAMVLALCWIYRYREALGWYRLSSLLTVGGRRRVALDLLLGGVASLSATAVAVASAFALGWLGRAESPYDFWAPRTATALVGALLVALIEESFFRGMMTESLVPGIGAIRATLASSAAYALVHLLVSDPSLGREGFTLGAGFGYLFRAVGRQVEPAALLPLGGLFLSGLVLSFAVRRSGALPVAIGLHAGWAFSFQVLRHATRPLVEIPGRSFLATHLYLVGTPWAWGGIVGAGLLVLAALTRRSVRPLG